MYFSTRMRDYNSGLDIETARMPPAPRQPGARRSPGRATSSTTTPSSASGSTDGTADLGRITRQQIFIRKVIGRAESKATGLNILATNNLVHSVIKNLKVDSSFSFTDMLGLLSDYKAFDADKLVSYTLPVTPTVTAGGADVLDLQTAQAQPTLQVFRGTTSSTKSYKPERGHAVGRERRWRHGRGGHLGHQARELRLHRQRHRQRRRPGHDHHLLRL